jgi:L-aspartate oxidase
VEVVCREGPARVLELAALGARFTTNADGSLHLTREGGHSHRRIVHAADLTGGEIERALLAAARSHPNVTFFEHHLAVDLVTDEVRGVRHCFGVDALDTRPAAAGGGGVTRFVGLATMLACGGAGHVYPHTTNPSVATGDGMAMAYRAHATLANMEFVQFHPTALYTPPGAALAGGGDGGAAADGRTFLITEAVRGEGGRLYNLAGERFMAGYDARLELAPRDVVARAIQDQMLRRGEAHVWLDISHKPADELRAHFPNIAARCAAQGVDITAGPIPVLPAQHYMCGGVQTGLLGETSVQGLFACGEVACSGLHGANRLASNSLLEGLVFADRAVGPSVAHAEYALKACGRQLHYAAASAEARSARPLPAATAAWAAAARAELRATMWRAAGIVRRSGELAAAAEALGALGAEVAAATRAHGVAAPLVELRNLLTCAELIVGCALQRRESRGLHYNADFPATEERECRPSLASRAPAGVGAARLAEAAAAAAAAGGGGGSSPRGARKVVRDLSVRSMADDA